MKTSTSMAIRVVSGLALLLGILIGSTHPVSAKGPESVTITGPGIDQPLELMTTTNQDLIVQLMEQTRLWYGADQPLQKEPLGDLGPAYTLTWVNLGPPDRSIEERTIRQLIYLDAENGPLIQTPDQESLQGWGPDVIGWFAAPVELRDTLIELGAPIAAAPALAEQPRSGISDAPALPVGQPVPVPRSLAILALALLIVLAAALGVVWKRVKSSRTKLTL